MAVDSREKRNSALTHLMFGQTVGVDPSSIDAAERLATVWIYSGISVASPVAGRIMSSMAGAGGLAGSGGIAGPGGGLAG